MGRKRHTAKVPVIGEPGFDQGVAQNRVIDPGLDFFYLIFSVERADVAILAPCSEGDFVAVDFAGGWICLGGFQEALRRGPDFGGAFFDRQGLRRRDRSRPGGGVLWDSQIPGGAAVQVLLDALFDRGRSMICLRTISTRAAGVV
jgi:hypothetical protein